MPTTVGYDGAKFHGSIRDTRRQMLHVTEESEQSDSIRTWHVEGLTSLGIDKRVLERLLLNLTLLRTHRGSSPKLNVNTSLTKETVKMGKVIVIIQAEQISDKL